MLLASYHDTPDYSTLGQCESCYIGHLFLWTGRKETDDSDIATIGYRVDALRDSSCAAVFEDIIHALVSGNFEDLFRPIWCSLVVDSIIGAVLFMDVRKLLVGRGRDDGCRASRFRENETSDGNPPSTFLF